VNALDRLIRKGSECGRNAAVMKRLRGRKRAATLTAAVVAFALGPWSQVAHAETGDLTCTGNFQFDFSPPLTPANTTADAAVGGGLVNCQSPNGKYPRLKSGVRTGDGTATRHFGDQCAPVMTIVEKAELIWNTGEKSKFDITVNTDPSAGRVTISARFTSGPLAGDTANAYPVVHPNADCAVVGLSQLTSEALQVFWE
jgi:hypothetical protein